MTTLVPKSVVSILLLRRGRGWGVHETTSRHVTVNSRYSEGKMLAQTCGCISIFSTYISSCTHRFSVDGLNSASRALLGLQIVHASRPPYFCAAPHGRSVLLKAVSQCMGRSNRNYIVLTLLSHMKSSTKRRVNNDAVNTRRIIIWVFAENARCLLYSHLGFPIWEWLSSKGMDTISYRSKTPVNFGVWSLMLPQKLGTELKKKP